MGWGRVGAAVIGGPGTTEGLHADVAGRVVDADVLRAWMASAVPALEVARERIDAVNVFPVADGDTGTNVLLTLRGSVQEAAGLPLDAAGPELLRAVARGALLAARGNSGVIVSRYLGGLAEAADGALAVALDRAATAARAAVHEPEDGTVLTVAAVIAGTTGEAAARGLGDADALAAGVAAGRTDLARISAAHPVLRSARVVDAGACALLVLLDALAGALAGRTEPVDVGWLAEHAPAVLDTDAHLTTDGLFEVMAVLRTGATGAAGPSADTVGAALAQIGEAVAVVDGDGLFTAHVHTADPATALGLLGLGSGSTSGSGTATVRRLVGASRALVACTDRPALAAPLALTGAVVLVLPVGGVSIEVARTAVDRAVQDAFAPVHTMPVSGAPTVHGVTTVSGAPTVPGCAAVAGPVVVLPGAGLDPAAVRIEAGSARAGATRVVLTDARDDLRVLVAATAAVLDPDVLADLLGGLHSATADDLEGALDAAERLLAATWTIGIAASSADLVAESTTGRAAALATVHPAPPMDPEALAVSAVTVLLGAGATATDGLDLADRLSARYPDVPVVVAGPVPDAPAYRLAVTGPPTPPEVLP